MLTRRAKAYSTFISVPVVKLKIGVFMLS